MAMGHSHPHRPSGGRGGMERPTIKTVGPSVYLGCQSGQVISAGQGAHWRIIPS